MKPSGSPAVPRACAAGGILPDGLVKPHMNVTFRGESWGEQPVPPALHWVLVTCGCSLPTAGYLAVQMS